MVTTDSLRNWWEGWQAHAPWPELNWRRCLALVILLGLPALIGGLAFVGALSTSFCGLWAGECTPEEQQQIRILSAIAWGSYLAVVAGFGVVLLLRRRVFWLVAGVIGLLNFLEVLF